VSQGAKSSLVATVLFMVGAIVAANVAMSIAGGAG
jgi:hypothetical protein